MVKLFHSVLTDLVFLSFFKVAKIHFLSSCSQLAEGLQLEIGYVAKTGTFTEIFINVYCPRTNKLIKLKSK